MGKICKITLAAVPFWILSCSPTHKFNRLELTELERKGYSISVDSIPVRIRFTYLNDANISKITTDKKNKRVIIYRKDGNSIFYSASDLISRTDFSERIELISVDGVVLDRVMIQETKFEEGAVRYVRLLTQQDYDRREFDDLPHVKETVGKGILIINTR